MISAINGNRSTMILRGLKLTILPWVGWTKWRPNRSENNGNAVLNFNTSGNVFGIAQRWCLLLKFFFCSSLYCHKKYKFSCIDDWRLEVYETANTVGISEGREQYTMHIKPYIISPSKSTEYFSEYSQ